MTKKQYAPSGKWALTTSVLLLNLLLIAGLIVLFSKLPFSPIQLCVRSTARTILTALGITFLVDVLIAMFMRKNWLQPSLISICTIVLIGAITFWQGSYSFSPFSLTTGKYPVLQGFLLTREGRINQPISPNEVVLLQYGVPAGISVKADLTNMSCHWSSLSHGALDSPEQCDIVYSPPGTENDILTVRIESKCMPRVIQSQIKISITP